jgi:hypothetical protein
MPPFELDITRRDAQDATPEDHVNHNLLDDLLRALPPPPDGATVAWRHAYLRRVVEELAAFAPFTSMDAMMATQIVVCRHLAARTASQSVDPMMSMKVAAEMRRSVQALLRIAGQMERLLPRRRTAEMPGNQVLVEIQVDLTALDAVWCGTAAVEREPAGLGAVAAPSPAPLGEATSPAGRARHTLCGQPIDHIRLETIPPAGSA